MLEELQNRFRVSSLALLMGPPIICLLIFSVLLLRARMASHEEAFTAEATAQIAKLDEVLGAEAIRVRTLAQLPIASSIAAAAQRREAARQDNDEQLEGAWSRSAREDLVVRSVLDNDLATLFRNIEEQQPALSGLLLADAAGLLLAAPNKPERFVQRNEPWWQAVRELSADTVASSGVQADGSIDLLSPVIRAGRASTVDGAIHAKLNLAALAAAKQIGSTDDRVLFVLGGGAPWIVGDAGARDARVATFADKLLLKVEASGHEHGYRYLNRPLNGGVVWGSNHVSVVYAVREAAMPFSVLLPPGIFFLILAGALVALALVVVPIGARQFFEPLRETLDSGVWVLRTAFGRGGVGGRTTPIQKELASWYALMQQELQRQHTSLSVDVTRDLEMATEFQQAFLKRQKPNIPEVHLPGRLRLEFAYRYQPALAMGGDFFDIQALATDTAGIFVGDVMGHGTRSALIVAILRTLIADQSKRGRNAPHFLREMNNEFSALLRELPQPFFASAAYFVADTTARVATYSVAGHPPPFHLHREFGRVMRLDVPKPQGAALGLIMNEEYGGGSVRLNDGDAFIFFTDGVYEAANASGEEFGFARLEKVIRANVYRSSREILDSIMDAITVFCGTQPVADDVCLLAVDVTTTARPDSSAKG